VLHSRFSGGSLHVYAPVLSTQPCWYSLLGGKASPSVYSLLALYTTRPRTLNSRTLHRPIDSLDVL